MATPDTKDSEKPGKFETPDELSDVTLIVEEKQLHVHKTVLGLHSAVFRKMFSSNFKESTTSEVPLPGKTYQAVVNFLHQIYPGPMCLTPIQDNTLVDMLALADEYQVDFLVDKCKVYIEKKIPQGVNLSVDQTLMYLYLCHKYSHHLKFWDDLWKIALTKDYREVKKNHFFLQLPEEYHTKMLNLRCERLESIVKYCGIDRYNMYTGRNFEKKTCKEFNRLLDLGPLD